MKKPSELSFADFAENVRPSGAVNRLPSIGDGADVHSYTVYMNGPLADQLPAEARDQDYKDVMLYALTDKLGLDSESFRDNLKVAELVATRNAWMTAVLENSMDRASSLSEAVTADYELLTNGMTHPWIQGELDKQRALSMGLQPALAQAGAVVGGVVKDRAPREFTMGKVVSQNTDFTVQATSGGEVVTHENRRLGVMPALGEEVTVAYYRGGGQVFGEECVNMSSPFVDKASGDLAVKLMDAAGNDKQVVLFNGVASFAKFVETQGLDKALVGQAISVREATPKMVVIKETPVRNLVSGVYLDDRSGCLAVDYKEGAGQFTALFGDAQALEANAKEFGIGADVIAAGKKLEAGRASVFDDVALESVKKLGAELNKLGITEILEPLIDHRNYVGKVVAASPLHVAQNVDRGTVVIHDLRDLDKAAAKGDLLTVNYANGRGRVTEMVREAGKEVGR